MTINYLDLFSGIGGFRLGLEQAGVKIDKSYHSEIDKYAEKIYSKHFPDSIALGDICKIDGTKLGKIDLITFGFPCQDLSIAGKRAGLGGCRSGLFFEATRLIRECKPGVFIFENVEGLFSADEGEAFEVVLREIADIGLYECEWQLVNTSWVLPQNRSRVYFIGHLGKESGQKVFPITESDFGITERATETTTVRTITGGGHSGGHHSGMTILTDRQTDSNNLNGQGLQRTGQAREIQLNQNESRTIRSGGRGSKTEKHQWDLVRVKQ